MSVVCSPESYLSYHILWDVDQFGSGQPPVYLEAALAVALCTVPVLIHQYGVCLPWLVHDPPGVATIPGWACTCAVTLVESLGVAC